MQLLIILIVLSGAEVRGCAGAYGSPVLSTLGVRVSLDASCCLTPLSTSDALVT